MTASCGKWLTIAEYAEASGTPESEAWTRVMAGKLVTKVVAGREYVWLDVPDCFADPHPPGPPPAAAPAQPDPEPKANPAGAAAEAVVGETLATRFGSGQELVLQAERAIGLVERSLGTFMMMHQEVVAEKDRSMENSRRDLQEKDYLLGEKDERLKSLEQLLKERDQEIADLKMLVEILEGQAERSRVRAAAPEIQERASVGDLIEDQLRYLMEDQMIKDLLK